MQNQKQNKLIDLFPPELRTASVVNRWSIVWTLTHDNIAQHSFYVTFYSSQLADLLRWTGPLSSLMYIALTHDLEEVSIGDLVSPVKNEIIDRKRYNDFVDLKMRERLPGVMNKLDDIAERVTNWEDDIDAIITVADRLDALLFLIGERRMGNGVVAPRIPSALTRLEAAWYELPADKDRLGLLWNTVMIPAIKAHEDQGGNGV